MSVKQDAFAFKVPAIQSRIQWTYTELWYYFIFAELRPPMQKKRHQVKVK